MRLGVALRACSGAAVVGAAGAGAGVGGAFDCGAGVVGAACGYLRGRDAHENKVTVYKQ